MNRTDKKIMQELMDCLTKNGLTVRTLFGFMPGRLDIGIGYGDTEIEVVSPAFPDDFLLAVEAKIDEAEAVGGESFCKRLDNALFEMGEVMDSHANDKKVYLATAFLYSKELYFPSFFFFFFNPTEKQGINDILTDVIDRLDWDFEDESLIHRAKTLICDKLSSVKKRAVIDKFMLGEDMKIVCEIHTVHVEDQTVQFTATACSKDGGWIEVFDEPDEATEAMEVCVAWFADALTEDGIDMGKIIKYKNYAHGYSLPESVVGKDFGSELNVQSGFSYVMD